MIDRCWNIFWGRTFTFRAQSLSAFVIKNVLTNSRSKLGRYLCYPRGLWCRACNGWWIAYFLVRGRWSRLHLTEILGILFVYEAVSPYKQIIPYHFYSETRDFREEILTTKGPFYTNWIFATNSCAIFSFHLDVNEWNNEYAEGMFPCLSHS